MNWQAVETTAVEADPIETPTSGSPFTRREARITIALPIGPLTDQYGRIGCVLGTVLRGTGQARPRIVGPIGPGRIVIDGVPPLFKYLLRIG
ncbi:hypothetical protein ACFO5R_16240 [Halosolutus amylolyticus]|uniref:Uncharacterized protein n=1 Tax=Halosolutus amylolyticus TaxID=2932267 RepID=A0ABD5PSA6_9EURY|nr:hypothetical protein [Halosolutus amylolyticus]